ncbi:hypothetical protein BX616_002019 [Lobosporangium transversale]|nr:hypothetical protein BX616_002019 [Lobosporangium transversale]
MANAGFFYAPTDDSNDNVQCPYCHLGLDGWEAKDDPIHEHQRRNPTCPFFATRAAAPTKASSAKATKAKKKDIASTDYHHSNEQWACAIAYTTQSKRITGEPRSSKEYTRESESSQSKHSVLKPSTQKISSEERLPSQPRSVEFDIFKASLGPKTSSSNRKPPIEEMEGNEEVEIFRRQKQRSQTEDFQQSVWPRVSLMDITSTSLPEMETIGPSLSQSSSSSSASAQKRRQREYSNEASSQESVSSRISVVIPKRRRLAKTEQFKIDSEGKSDESQKKNEWARPEDEIGPDVSNTEDIEDKTAKTSSPPSKTAPWERKLKCQSPDKNQKLSKVHDQGLDVSDAATAAPKKRNRSKKATQVASRSKKPSAHLTKRVLRSAALLKSPSKKSTKTLIEIFELPDEPNDDRDKQPPIAGSGISSEPVTVRTPPAPSPATPPILTNDEVLSTTTGVASSLPPTTGSTLHMTMDIDVEPEDLLIAEPPALTTDSVVKDSRMDQVTTRAPETAEVSEPTPVAKETPSNAQDILPVPSNSSLHSDIDGKDMANMAETQDVSSVVSDHMKDNLGLSSTPPSTPKRGQAVSMQDIVNARVVIVDHATPNKRVASSIDLEGWEDEDRRGSAETYATSPFVTPTKWHMDGMLSTSTPNARESLVQPALTFTPKQRIKDMVGGMSGDILQSPRAKLSTGRKTHRSSPFSPAVKQQRLIDRLENLMNENDSSGVLAVAENALNEEMKQLRRSQNKGRKLAVSATVSEEATEPAMEARQDTSFSTQQFEVANSNDNSPIQTPVRNTTANLLKESTVPVTPTHKTPLPISNVISAIGAASRRNNQGAVSPFVRTPAKKTIDLLALADLEVRGSSTGKGTGRERSMAKTELQEPASENPFIVTSQSSPLDSLQKMDKSKKALAFSQRLDSVEKGDEGEGGKKVKDEDQQRRSGSDKPPDLSSHRFHPDPAENERRMKLSHVCGLTESELKMTVEEFHRAVLEDQVRQLELIGEAWIQRFQEESDRVRSALLDDGML